MTDRAHVNRVITDSHGEVQAVPLTVTVAQPGTSTAIADTLYSDNSGTTARSNPFTVANGIVDFYLDNPQQVDLIVSDGTTTTTYQQLAAVTANPPASSIVYDPSTDPTTSSTDVQNALLDVSNYASSISGGLFSLGTPLSLTWGSYSLAAGWPATRLTTPDSQSGDVPGPGTYIQTYDAGTGQLQLLGTQVLWLWDITISMTGSYGAADIADMTILGNNWQRRPQPSGQVWLRQTFLASGGSGGIDLAMTAASTVSVIAYFHPVSMSITFS